MLSVVASLQELAAASTGAVQQHPVVDANVHGFSLALLKAQIHAYNEYCGYRLASLARVKVPRMLALLNASASSELESCGLGSIGLLIEYHTGWLPVSRDRAALLDPVATGRALALCTLDRHEWGEFGVADGTVHFVDLERLLPSVLLDHLDSMDSADAASSLALAGESYRSMALSVVEEAVREASRLGVSSEFSNAMSALRALTNDDLRTAFSIRPHRLSDPLSAFMAAHALERIELAALVTGQLP